MDPFPPFGGSVAHGLPSWHYGGHSDSSFCDCGYSSEDSDHVTFLPLSPDHIYGDTDQVDHKVPKIMRHRAAAFVNAQWSRPADSRACHCSHGSANDNWRTYELPQPLAFEQQRNSHECGSRPKPATYYSRERFGCEPGHIACRWHLEEKISPLDFEEHRARVPSTLQSLSNRIASETDQSSPSPDSIRPRSPSPEVNLKAPKSRGFPAAAQPGQRTEDPMGSSARRSCRNQSSSRNRQLAAAWELLYQERLELEKEKRAWRNKDDSLVQGRK